MAVIGYNPSGVVAPVTKTPAHKYIITPDQIGMRDFADVDRVPGISPKDREAVKRNLAELNNLAARAQSGNKAAQQMYQRQVGQFQKYWAGLLQGDTYVAPAQPYQQPAAPAPAPQAAPVQQAQGGAAPAGGAPPATPGITSGMDWESEFMKQIEGMLGDDSTSKLEGMSQKYLEEQLGGASGFGANDQRILDETRKSLSDAAAVEARRKEVALSGMGLRKSDQLGTAHEEVTGNLLRNLREAEITIRTNAANRGEAAKMAAFDRAQMFAAAVKSNRADVASLLLQAQQNDVQNELTKSQWEFTKEMEREAMSLNRDKFSEEQRENLRRHGLSEKQIEMTEKNLLWEQAWKTKQQAADIDLAYKNLDQVERIQGRQLSLEEFRIESANILNNRGQDLAERTFEFTREIGLDTQAITRLRMEMERDLANATTATQREQIRLQYDIESQKIGIDKDKLAQTAKQIELEYGLRVNQLALERTIRTGELDLNILNSQRQYDLSKADQQEKWLATEAARDLQERLGMRELDLKEALGNKELDLRSDAMYLEKWMFEAGLNWDKEKFRIQLQEARRKKKGGIFGKIVKTLVGAGVGFLTGGPAGAVVGAAQSLAPDLMSGMKEAGLDVSKFLNSTPTAGHPAGQQIGTSGQQSTYNDQDFWNAHQQ